ncbi:ANTAR domain-containing response regulator [Faecalibacterium duncaniae]|uniref:ANTAR domain-containing response regulator n=1 Tax=Faecalibacterium duncaniae (strain DSM 17677 / JCM 31915 / A2-165) TaxID=411483 RepID=UPI0002EFA968|nr:ANTAR domain-containing protein [Faecalibacterium duncaniae]
MLLAKAAAAEQLLTPMSEQGVLLLSKPFSNTLFLQAIHLAAASNHRLQLLRQENARMQEKIAQVRLVSHAKCCLVAREQMSEDAAHRYIEKRAMDTRRSRAEIAQEILDSYED